MITYNISLKFKTRRINDNSKLVIKVTGYYNTKKYTKQELNNTLMTLTNFHIFTSKNNSTKS